MDVPVIFIVIDSSRYYKTNIDDRGRIDYLDKFAKISVEYTNAITSAPSSVMAAASMFTGLESAYLARNYNDWEFDLNNFDSLQNILKRNGYQIFSIDNSRTGREVTKDLTQPLSKKYFPRGISHRNFWTNFEMVSILKKILNTKPNKKSFFMFWFDCRNDPNTSKCVEDTIELFKQNNFFNDSLTIITSDHGYPDPSTGLNVNSMRNMRHDMVVTDDNIKVPLFIKTPNNTIGNFNEIVGHIDLMPTILETLNINISIKNKNLISGINILNKNNLSHDRIIRTDTRLLLQKGRITSLRNNYYKLVIYHDENKKDLYDLKKDSEELNPITNYKNDIYNLFYNFYCQSNKKINQYHIDYINLRLQNLEEKFAKIGNNLNVLIYGQINKILINQIANYFASSKLKIKFSLPKLNFIEDYTNNIFFTDNYTSDNYDIGLYITEKKHYMFDDPKLFKKYSKKCKFNFCYDFNLAIYNRLIVRWFNPLLKYKRNFYFYRDDFTLIYYDLVRLIKNFYLVYIKKENTLNPDMQEIKQLRDRAVRASMEFKSMKTDENKL